VTRLSAKRAVVSRRDFACGLAGAAAFSAFGAPAAANATDGALIALVHTQAAGDNGVVDGMIDSLHRIARERKLTARAIYAADPANFEPMLQLLGEAGAVVVFTTFDEMTEPLKAVAPDFPKTRFVQIYGDPIVPPIANLRTVSYETWVASYLAGVCGAQLSRADRLGYIGGVSIPTLNAGVNALIAGARSIRPKASVSAAFVGSFQDPAKALEIANQMFGGGIDYVQADGAASDLGVIESANAHPGRIVSGGARQQFPLGPTSVAAITQCDFGLSLYEQGTAALGEAWKGGHYRSGLKDGVVDFVASPLFLSQGPPAEVARFRAGWPAVQRDKSRIIAGTLHVPFLTALA
jgi:basic membrane protein A